MVRQLGLALDPKCEAHITPDQFCFKKMPLCGMWGHILQPGGEREAEERNLTHIQPSYKAHESVITQKS